MRVPLSWLRELVPLADSPEALAARLTFAGLEVEHIQYVGVAASPDDVASRHSPGLVWQPDTIVIADVVSSAPHPNADRLTILRLDDGSGAERTVVTGAPNARALGRGVANQPSPKVVYAREGAVVYDAHKGDATTVEIRRAVVRGVESDGVVCSERELGISDDHEGLLLVEPDARTGIAAAELLGDVLLDVKINPNMARNANVVGLARECAALTGAALTHPEMLVQPTGPSIEGQLTIHIQQPELNARFLAGLIEGVRIAPSPYRIQRRLKAVGVRPINNIVDATNYVMFELGQPLHAFDWDALRRRAGGRPPALFTRLARSGETIRTLDGKDRRLDDFTIMVGDEAGLLSLAGVMGGHDTEVTNETANVLLEAASWDPVSIRRTAKAQDLASEASYRFARGVHPAMAPRGLARALVLMQAWAGGSVAQGVIDTYPRPAPVSSVQLPLSRVTRLLGASVPADDVVRILGALEFDVAVESTAADGEPETLTVTAPDHRLDIGRGLVGQADVIEEVGRVYGYNRIPEQPLAEPIPAALPEAALEKEERVRDLLADLGLLEAMSYSLTSVERETWLRATGEGATPEYVRLLNPIAVDRAVMRQSVLPGLLDAVAANLRHAGRVALFEVGPVFLPQPARELPDERTRLGLALSGLRQLETWQGSSQETFDFFDLKGVVEELLVALRLDGASYHPEVHPTFVPGRTAALKLEGRHVGWLGQVHPLVLERFRIAAQAVVVAAELELDQLGGAIDQRFTTVPIPTFPAVHEDLAVVVGSEVPAVEVSRVIRAAGGPWLVGLRLFDVYQGAQLNDPGKKSLAFSLQYQAKERTLTSAEVVQFRNAIVEALSRELGATIRG
jgi:phenylalanyl-tRNA synthetase beta chain